MANLVHFNGGLEISFKDLIWIICVLAAVIGSWYALPNKIQADCTVRYASRERVDMMSERLERIENKVDKIADDVSRIR